MAEQWNETEDYRAVHGEYVQKMTAAVAAETPEIAKLQADNWWLGKQAEIRDAHYQATTTRSALETAVNQVKTTHPHIPEALLSMARTPEEVQAMVAAMPAPPKASSRTAPAARPATTPTGGPPPSATSTPSSEEPGWGDSGRRWNDREYLAGLIEKANNYSGDGSGKSSKYVDELIELFMDNRVFTQMGFHPDGTPAI